jgi:opacity protein-like surface antigen
MKMTLPLKLVLAGSLAVGLLATAQSAEAVAITGSGLWGAGTPVTTYSAPDDSFSFSFDLPSPTESNPSGEITNFVYKLDGVNVATAADTPFITFFGIAQGGMFDLSFPVSGDDITLEGAQIGFDRAGDDTSGNAITIRQGSFTFSATADFPGATTGTGSLAVPEPASVALLTAGLVALCGIRRRSAGRTPA